MRYKSNIYSLLLMAGLMATPLIAQMPTHIDPGANDPGVDVGDSTTYIIIVVGFLALLVAFFVLLRNKKKRKNT